MSFNDDSSKRDYSSKKLGTRHIQIFLIFLGKSVIFAGRYSISIAVVAMSDANSTNSDYQTYNWGSETRSFVLSSFLWGYVTMQIPSGYIADIYSAHKLLCFALFISSLLNTLTPLTVYYFDWIGVLICRVFMGLTQSCIIPCSHTFISRWIPHEERSRLSTLTLIGPPVGNIISLTVSGWLARSSLGWPSIFYIFGVIGMLWSLLFYYAAADSPSKHKKICPLERDYIENSLNKSKDLELKAVKVPWRSILTSLPIWVLIITHCGEEWGTTVLLTKLPAYTKYALGYDIEQSGMISALPFIATLVIGILYGWICDFALQKNVSLSIVRKVSNTIGMWGPSVALLVLCLIDASNTVVQLIILTLIVGLDAANFCGFHINHIDLAPNFAGAQSAILNTAGIVFAQFAPIVCGYIVTDEANLDQWHIIFYINAALYFVTNFIFITFGRTDIQPWNSTKPTSTSAKDSNNCTVSEISSRDQ